MKKNYDKKHMERSYEPGELVAVWTPIRKIGKAESSAASGDQGDTRQHRRRQGEAGHNHHENYIFVELCPDIPDYSYLRAIGDLVGGPKNITHFGRMNGHYIVGLASRNLASLLVEEGPEHRGNTPQGLLLPCKRAERIICGQAPRLCGGRHHRAGFCVNTRDITSIAPIMIKMGGVRLQRRPPGGVHACSTRA
ncbi:hypothetical protein LAZ67_8003839 [Cordylochernes scorpioides]|uniref:Uncharacterized protein n=1 Tax=Cordylochernes scorpioides TaxID=51811 RepID=A0ABY6KRX0_9ARAC|nr:hypothetical protein LAZ67_8003839 [Cordylochernes scorpioides]